MRSMTGYGKAAVTRCGRELTVELKSVNHRFLDISTKIPRMFIAYEDVIRNALASGISRGHVDVYLNYSVTDGNDKKVSADVALARSYAQAAETLARALPQVENDFRISALMRIPDVIVTEQNEESEETLRAMLNEGVKEAVKNLNAMRENEGARLKTDILNRINAIETLLSDVAEYAPKVAEDYRAKLMQRVGEALNGVDIDEARLAAEVCFFTDKSSIDEEITRLHCHIANAREILSSAEPTGRKLDFLVQEFNRETNTICSKSGDVKLTDTALALKNEIEKVREQVQNIE